MKLSEAEQQKLEAGLELRALVALPGWSLFVERLEAMRRSGLSSLPECTYTEACLLHEGARAAVEQIVVELETALKITARLEAKAAAEEDDGGKDPENYD